MAISIPGYTINQAQIYSGLYTIIFSGIHTSDKKNVVIKLMKESHPSPDNIARFRHEYEIAHEFLTENDIVHVASLEKHDNSLAIIMENINTPTIAEILDQQNKFTLSDFLEIAINLTQAVGHIHQHNIIHKDINPSNIMLNPSNHEVKIIDFGLSANLPRERAELVSPNVLEGTLSYLSPEQTGRMNRGIDYRTDYYSLGVTFYQMLTGMLPFISNDPMELIHSHIAVTPKSPSDLDSHIPSAISGIIMKLLAKKAEDRYQNSIGLLSDLQECRSQLLNTGQIKPFTLGTKDIFNRFQIPEKLYGRENEIDTLMKTYESVANGSVELLLVAGYSGIGKSTLVHEIHKPILQRRGYFITGKFDQFKHNIPYAAFSQAFEEFIKLILTEQEEQIDEIRQNILKAVGENGKLITEVIPNLVSIIGEQPEVPELGPTESQNRFSFVFQNFIKSLASKDHPLTIFLDDLQWADLPSLKMLDTLLLSSDCHHLFIIGAYRSNEVNPAHPLVLALEEINKKGVKYKLIDLGPLDIKNASLFIADTLHQTSTLVQALANLCYEKTNGNPFFLIQLLLSLYKDRLIEFDNQNNRWAWNLEQIKLKNITDNVVDLMLNKLRELTPRTQKVLTLAACIGNQFDLHLLSAICNKEPKVILIDLQEALKEGYIISHGDAYRANQFQFSHDRIQQAAHTLIDENERKDIHIRLARIILQQVPSEKLEESIFTIVNHYNTSIKNEIPSILMEDEKRKIAELNLKASQVAKLSAAYEPALQYISYAMKCLSPNSWLNDYDFTLNIYNDATENAYLAAKFDIMEQYANVVLKNTKDPFDQHKVIHTKVLAYIAQTKPNIAIDTVLQVLSKLGVHFPAKPKLLHVLISVLKIKFLLLGKKISNLINLPEMTDPTKKAAVEFLSLAYAPAYFANQQLFPLLICQSVILSLKYGNTKLSAYPYTGYGMMSAGVLGEIDNGYEFGELGLNLIEKYPDSTDRTQTIFINYTMVKHWKDHLHDLLPKLLENYEKGLDTGNLDFGCYSNHVYIAYSYLAGSNLKQLLSKIEIYKPYMKQLQQITNFNFMCVFHQATLNFVQHQESPPYLLDGFACNEKELEKTFLKANDKLGLFYLYFYKLILAFTFESYDNALDYIKKTDHYQEGALATYFIPTFYFYKCLTLLEIISNKSKNEANKIRSVIKRDLKRLKKWQKFSPRNYLHKYLLIKAQLAWLDDKNIEKAMQLFDEAIYLSKQNEFLNEEALANEIAGRFYLKINKDKIASLYLNEARHCYLLWGANEKVSNLDAQYPSLVSNQGLESLLSSGVSTSASERSASRVLDINTIQKSSQAISSTIVLSSLLKKLIHIVLENAGAQKCYLLLPKKGKYYIEAEGDINKEESNVLKSVELTPDILPLSMINYVIHSKESIVLDNATRSNSYNMDRYVVSNQPKSVLCMPLLNQGEISGILYLENNLTDGAFTTDRIQVLNLLSSQIAISIDNARLYSNTKNLNEKLIILNQAYERFVPQDFLSLLNKKSIIDVGLGDQVQQKMSVLFTDIRSFTTRSEKMTPEENFKFINSFLSVVAPVIRKYHGFVDKYIGDAIMALYPRSPDDALHCALEMQTALADYNKQHPEQEPVKIGIGINTGLLMLGTVGETNRMNATVISDTVNIASRVESLTKNYDVPILATEDTIKNLSNPARFSIQMVDDTVFAKGKTKAIAVFRVDASTGT